MNTLIMRINTALGRIEAAAAKPFSGRVEHGADEGRYQKLRVAAAEAITMLDTLIAKEPD